MILAHARGELSSTRCLVMGIVNRTPDSFYDGGRMELGAAGEHALRLLDEGADLLDVGAVKAGPGPDVDDEEEMRRLIPLVETIARRSHAVVSVETSSPSVARRAIEAGAAIINDVSGLADTELCSVCAETRAGLILMHHGGQRRGRPRHPRYDDVVAEVKQTWEEMIAVARSCGVADDAIVVDPGLDFGKTTFHSLELMRRVDELVASGWPVLMAPSRKDVVGETLGLPLQERLEGTLALVALSARAGVAIVRVHDVRASVRTVAMVEAVLRKTTPTAPIRGLWD